MGRVSIASSPNNRQVRTGRCVRDVEGVPARQLGRQRRVCMRVGADGGGWAGRRRRARRSRGLCQRDEAIGFLIV